jgi:hypothetical protein
MTKFSLKKKLLPSLMAASLASGVAFSGNASALEVAADGTGQVLLAPVYIVDVKGSPQGPTYIRVINTSPDHAVKARIGFRSQVNSTEVLDFILYLSPRDVWRGMVVNVNGQAYVKSTDDSIRNLPNADSFASIEGTPANVKMFDVALAADDNNEMGHFDIIAAYSVKGTVQTPKGSVTIKQGMSKFDLAKIFDTPLGSVAVANSLLALNNADCPAGATTTCMIRTDEPASVQLRGEVSMVLLGERYNYIMTALDADDKGNVISNPFFDVEVTFGLNLGGDFPGAGLDNILDIETALAAKSYGATYQNGDGASVVFVTFPTKYRHLRSDVCQIGKIEGEWTRPFNATGSMGYTISQFDNQEHGVGNTVEPPTSVSGDIAATPSAGTAITPEVEWFSPAWKFESGWYSLNMNERTGCPYSGAPAIVYTMTLRDSSSEFFQNSPRK